MDCQTPDNFRKETKGRKPTMIGYLSGTILNLDEQSLILKVKDVGYEVHLGNVAEMNLGGVGDTLELWTYTYVREDQITLFGFKEPALKRIFLVLLAVNGVGPKLAMALVSQLSPDELFDALTTANGKALCRVPGVGKKMAERLILELKDKLPKILTSAEWTDTGSGGSDLALWNDLVEALTGLGFSDQKIRNVIKLLKQELGGKQPDINELLKLALQKIRQC